MVSYDYDKDKFKTYAPKDSPNLPDLHELTKAQLLGFKALEPNENPDRGGGMKYDRGKPMASILFDDFPVAMAGAINVATFGAQKYARNSWKTVPNAIERYSDAMFRHWLAMKLGEYLDKESGLPHIYHFLWGALAIAQLMGEINDQTDLSSRTNAGHQ